MKKGIILLLFILVLPSLVHAIGISPDMTYIKFEPLKEGSFVVRVINTEDRPLNASIRLEGTMAKYFTAEPKSIIVAPFSSTPIAVSYLLPYAAENPGLNQIVINTLENIPNSGGVTATLNVLSKVMVDVPYPNKYLEYSFNVNNINLEENLTMHFDITSKGEENIFSVEPVVKIYSIDNLNEVIIRKEAVSFALNKGVQKPADIRIQGKDIGTGVFIAEAVVNYDGLKSKEILQNFTIGYKDVVVLDYTRKLLSAGIREFKVTLGNKWNKPVDEVYIVAYLEKDGAPITEKSFSYTIGMAALETVSIPVFLNIGDLASGDYKVVLDIYYGGLVKQERLDVVVEKGFELSTGMIVAGIIILLIILDIGWMIFERKSTEKTNSSEENMKKLSRK